MDTNGDQGVAKRGKRRSWSAGEKRMICAQTRVPGVLVSQVARRYDVNANQIFNWLHADGYAGFNELYRRGDVQEVTCMAHMRRKFVDVHKSQGLAIAEEAIKRIAKLYGVEKEVRGQPPDEWVKIRQRQSKPIFDDLEA